MSSYQILWGSRPFPKEIGPRGSTGFVQQVKAMLGRDPATCYACSRVTAGSRL